MFEEFCGISAFKVVFGTEFPMWSAGTYINDSIRSSVSVEDSCSFCGGLHEFLFRRPVQGQSLSDNPKLRI